MFVDEKSFYLKIHKKLFSILVELFTKGEKIDFVTVLEASMANNVFNSQDKAKLYLTELMDAIPSISNLSSYCKIVKEKETLRNLIVTAKKIIEMAASSDSQVEEILDSAEQQIFEIRQDKKESKLIRIDEVLEKEFEHLEKLATGQIKVGIPSGYFELDAILSGGLNPSDLIVLAARPAMGKTSFVLNIAARVAKQNKTQVAIFSLEMSVQQLVERMLSFECSIVSNKIHSADFKNDEWTMLFKGASSLSKCKIFFDDSTNLTVPEMKAKLRRFSNLGLVVIDYLQLMRSGRKEANRVQEISEITRMLKTMAKELNVLVIVIFKLEKAQIRQDHRPVLSDLRESGSIEQDADIVMFLYRDEYYNPEKAKPGIAECIVAKNRHGETATFELGWESRFTRFMGLDKFHDEENS